MVVVTICPSARGRLTAEPAARSMDPRETLVPTIPADANIPERDALPGVGLNADVARRVPGYRADPPLKCFNQCELECRQALNEVILTTGGWKDGPVRRGFAAGDGGCSGCCSSSADVDGPARRSTGFARGNRSSGVRGTSQSWRRPRLPQEIAPPEEIDDLLGLTRMLERAREEVAEAARHRQEGDRQPDGCGGELAERRVITSREWTVYRNDLA